ncbi:hypothetical protein ATI61_104624 [Archangium gephyra]|uniref:DUF6310 domain-containing protein n=1 Tax=Archangium gephyra TaxID=48 RepID=A0AAC8Q2R6_9BACT|nr:DUF6310 domain-containing protein [Archangium gephyra]AKI99958.1 Hypothetical protein AA314_01585 [Archangium gephyra]REG33333.1 hypothetical protein ATI61_104624 [Archangium gephyra]
MLKKHPSPAVGEGSGTQLEAWWSSWGSPRRAVRAVLASVLGLQLACATSYPMGGGAQVAAEEPREDRVVANLRRAAKLPWTDGGRCVVEEAGQPWADLVERCFYALDHERVRFRDTTGRCSVASAGAGALGIGVCVLAAPELVVGAVVVAGVVVVGFAISEALEAYEKRGRPQVRPPPTLPVPEARPVVETKPVPQQPKKKRRPKPEPAGEDWPPPVPPEPTDRERERKCEAFPKKHRGGDKAHDDCADRYPPNRWPGMDAVVDGKAFDALQVGVRVLWEIKTDEFGRYNEFVKQQELADELVEFEEESRIARACGYDFVVGVSTEEHKAALMPALEEAGLRLEVVVTGCKR